MCSEIISASAITLRCGGARSFGCRAAGITIWLPPDDDVFSRIGDAPRLESELDNLWSDPGAIAQRDANAPLRTTHARDRNRILRSARTGLDLKEKEEEEAEEEEKTTRRMR